MKRRNFLLFIAILTLTTVYGQKYDRPPNMLQYDDKKWHFGFTLGPEFQSLNITNNSENLIGIENIVLPDATYDGIENAYYYSEVTRMGIGFHVGIIASLRLGDYFNLRAIPSFSLGQKNIHSKMFIEEINNGESVLYESREEPITTIVKSTLITVPILVKYKAVRINNARPYIVAGPNFKCDLTTDLEVPVTLKRFDTFLEMGFGTDFYMQSFRLGVELRFGIGMMDMLRTDRPSNDPKPYITSSIDKIKAKTFTLAFNFE